MIVRPTIRGEALQVHGLEKTCNCHELIRWMRTGNVVGGGIEIYGDLAEPLDWIVKIANEIRIVKPDDFYNCYEEMQDEDII